MAADFYLISHALKQVCMKVTQQLMKSLPVLALLCLSIVNGCQRKSQDDVASSPNQALYNEVMSIHDEVMPKMNDIYKARTALRRKLEATELTDASRREINAKIAQLDSADEGMMVWMRKFDPIPDSLGEEKARQYLEEELVKVKKVKENILEALEGAQSSI